MKILAFIGITVLAYLFTKGLISAPFVDFPTIISGYINWILITIGIAQSLSILLVKYKTGMLKAIGEVTILASSFILLVNSEILFVVCNLILLASLKFYVTKPAKTEAAKQSAHHASLNI